MTMHDEPGASNARAVRITVSTITIPDSDAAFLEDQRLPAPSAEVTPPAPPPDLMPGPRPEPPLFSS